jgi:serine/threonine-protein kinase
VELGDNQLALAALSQAGKLSGGNSKAIAVRGYLLAKMGQPSEAQAVLETLEAISRERYVPPYAWALVHLGLEQKDLALEWLERSYQDRDVHLVFLPVDPKWDSVRGDGRFQALLERCRFSQAVAS